MFLIPVDILLAILNPFGVGLLLLVAPLIVVFITIILRLMFSNSKV